MPDQTEALVLQLVESRAEVCNLLGAFALQVLARDYYLSIGDEAMAEVIDQELLDTSRIWLACTGRPVMLSRGGQG